MDIHCTADDPLNCVWQDKIEAAPDVLKSHATPQRLIMHAQQLAMYNGQLLRNVAAATSK
jgi:hypothetical protein